MIEKQKVAVLMGGTISIEQINIVYLGQFFLTFVLGIFEG